MLQAATVSSGSSSLPRELGEGVAPPGRRRPPAACRRRMPRGGCADKGRRPRNGDAELAAPPPRRRRFRTGRTSRRNAGRHSPPYSRRSRAPARRSCRTGRSRASRRSATGPAGSRRSPRRRAAPSGSATTARRRCRAAGRRAAYSVSPQSASISWLSAPVAIGPRQASACPAATSWPSDSKLHALRLDRDQLLVLGRRALASLPSRRRLRRAVDVGVDQPDLLAHPRQRDGEIGGERRLADPALAAADRDRPCAPGCDAVSATRASLDARDGQRRGAQLALERAALVVAQARWRRRRARRCPPLSSPRADAARRRAWSDSSCSGSIVGHGRAHRRLRRRLATVFRARALPIVGS